MQLPPWRRFLLFLWLAAQLAFHVSLAVAWALSRRLAAEAWDYSIVPAALLLVTLGSRRSVQWLKVRTTALSRSSEP